MSRRALVTISATAAGLICVSPALAASTAPASPGSCLSMTLNVVSMTGTEPGDDTLAVKVSVLGPVHQRVNRLHLALQIQQRTSAAWVPVVTPQQRETFVNVPGSRVRRTWTLVSSADGIYALIRSGVQVRVSARFAGTCNGQGLGPPLFYGLSVPTLTPPAAAPAAPAG
ncbi:MAG TPA: hypothetical protein VHW26_07670 [Solirubrobacteraceae bacterium]|jgi:hypothetical protein|nr:hypothetical protein [Solirubrobacteraceae bacterium]